MAGQAEFLEMIQELERIAQTESKVLSMDMIRDYFSDMDLEDAQYDFICQYLESKGVKIEDRVKKQEGELSDALSAPIEMKEDPKDDEITRFYIEEAKTKGSLTREELKLLSTKIASGDGEAINQVIEGSLSLAIDVAAEFKNQGLLYSDLIQEANMAMMLSLSDLMAEGKVEEDLSEFLKKKIRVHLSEELEWYNGATRSAMKVADQVNQLNAKTMEFARENGREGKPDEIAKLMGLSEDEVRDLMKISLDAVSVMDSSDVGDFDGLRELAEGEDFLEEE